MNTETLSTIDQSLQKLQDTFMTYQQKQEQKMNTLEAAYCRLPSQAATYEHDQHFNDFVRKGNKGLTSNTQTGGYLIPNGLVVKILDQMKTTHNLRDLCSVIDITTDAYEVLVEKGSASVGWTQETQMRDETDLPELEKIHIPTFELYAKPKASQKMLDDSGINIEEWILSKISQSMANFENDAFLNGDGNTKPKGMLTSVQDGKIQCMQSDFKTADDLINAICALESTYLNGACFVMSRSVLAHMRTLKDASTGRYLLQPSLEHGMPTTLLGFPVILNDAMPVFAPNNICVLFGNFKQAYQIVDRKDVHLLRDPYSAKPFVEFYATKRVGGDLINPNAIKAIRMMS